MVDVVQWQWVGVLPLLDVIRHQHFMEKEKEHLILQGKKILNTEPNLFNYLTKQLSILMYSGFCNRWNVLFVFYMISLMKAVLIMHA